VNALADPCKGSAYFHQEIFMSFVKTLPEALAAAAGQLQGIGTSMAAQNASVAAPTTGVAPAAADEVSVLQATQFSAYGSLYQSISAQAQAIHEMFVNTLGTSAGSYGTAEASNTTAASSSSGLSSILGLLGFNSGTTGINGATSQLFNIGGGNWASASSDLLGMAGGGLIPSEAGAAGEAAGAEAGGLAAGLGGGLDGAVLSGAVGPAGLGGAPVLAGLGQASSVGALSVPPSWAGEVTPAGNATPATLAGAGWTAAAPHAASVTTMPAGMPSVASAGRGGYGFGAPRYGVKPTVMPKPAVV
jgi:PE family/PPE-SVP subfamily C-terminal region